MSTKNEVNSEKINGPSFSFYDSVKFNINTIDIGNGSKRVYMIKKQFTFKKSSVSGFESFIFQIEILFITYIYLLDKLIQAVSLIVKKKGFRVYNY